MIILLVNLHVMYNNPGSVSRILKTIVLTAARADDCPSRKYVFELTGRAGSYHGKWFPQPKKTF